MHLHRYGDLERYSALVCLQRDCFLAVHTRIASYSYQLHGSRGPGAQPGHAHANLEAATPATQAVSKL